MHKICVSSCINIYIYIYIDYRSSYLKSIEKSHGPRHRYGHHGPLWYHASGGLRLRLFRQPPVTWMVRLDGQATSIDMADMGSSPRMVPNITEIVSGLGCFDVEYVEYVDWSWQTQHGRSMLSLLQSQYSKFCTWLKQTSLFVSI